ncbi:MAG: hypothetical protein Q9227_000696 [Pyrenula ochraceoflavens]
MSSPGVDEIRALEQARARLQQLVSFQNQIAIILQGLQGVSKELTENEKILGNMVAYPTPQFPGRTQEYMLHMMLRTRLEPSVEDWIEHGKQIEEASSKPASETLRQNDLKALWNWAPAEANQIAREQRWGKSYTLAEKDAGLENIVTGLQKELVADSDEDEDEEEEDDDEEEEESENEEKDDSTSLAQRNAVQSMPMTVDQQSTTAPLREPMPMDKTLRFMMTGSMPAG